MFCPRIIFIVLRIALILGLLFAYIRYTENRNLFRPSSEIEALPKEAGLDFEDIYFKTDHNVILNGWFIPFKDAKKTVIFCHGNAGNISHRIEKMKIMHMSGCNVFIFDYKGYGKSKGRPSEGGLYHDAESAYNYLLSKGIDKKILLATASLWAGLSRSIWLLNINYWV
ncbi:alpha/beta hydrolase [bacterium]|nr:MAG: alpha/beta hydrolase [bacterium]